MNIIGVIPARMSSTRYPGKPMASILGMPMIGHVHHRAKMCASLKDVYVATCDEEIATYIQGIGGNAIMTSNRHERATERVAEALWHLEQVEKAEIDHVVMIQGDEPALVPDMIDQLIRPLDRQSELAVINLIAKIESREEFDNSNTVKVVFDQEGFGLYLSREPIPSTRKYPKEIPMWKQLGMILFSREILLQYRKMSPTPLEIIESVDMNRFLEYGIKIKMEPTCYRTFAVDIKEDVGLVEALLRKDVFINQYHCVEPA